MKLIYIFGIIALINVILLSGCTREEMALKEFKTSQAGSEMAKCVGATGDMEWKIFTSSDQKNPNVRVIEANLTKGNGKQKTLTIQWLYNLETKISELVYASKDGKKTNRLSMGLEVASFCM
jgi:hypothetical protein